MTIAREKLLRATACIPSSSYSMTTLEQIQKHTVAGLQLKLVGNERLKAGKPAEARAAYIEALKSVLAAVETLAQKNSGEGIFLPVQKDIEELRVQLVGNLALTEIKLELWRDALEHSSMVLTADPGNLKALFRRSIARVRLGEQLEGAKHDLGNLLASNSGSEEIRTELELCKKRIAETKSANPFNENLKRRMKPKPSSSFAAVVQSFMDSLGAVMAQCGGQRQ